MVIYVYMGIEIFYVKEERSENIKLSMAIEKFYYNKNVLGVFFYRNIGTTFR